MQKKKPSWKLTVPTMASGFAPGHHAVNPDDENVIKEGLMPVVETALDAVTAGCGGCCQASEEEELHADDLVHTALGNKP